MSTWADARQKTSRFTNRLVGTVSGGATFLFQEYILGIRLSRQAIAIERTLDVRMMVSVYDKIDRKYFEMSGLRSGGPEGTRTEPVQTPLL